MHLRSECRQALMVVLTAAAASTALAQAARQEPIPAPTASAPDACRLMRREDLEAVFPGRPIADKGPTLSPLSRGPQYVESCMYVVRLPNPHSASDLPKFASLTVVRHGSTGGVVDSERSFAQLRAAREKVAADPRARLQIDALDGVGHQAFQETGASRVVVVARKDDLVLQVALDNYSDETARQAAQLASQATARWHGGAGMVEAPTPLARAAAVAVPPDTRSSSVAPGDQWPDACTLLVAEDVKAVFPDMSIPEPRRLAGRITHPGRESRVETLPKPIGCAFDLRTTTQVDGRRVVSTHQVQLNVTNVAATTELSRQYFGVTQKVAQTTSPVSGLGDEAAIDERNRMHIRKGLATVQLRVSGGERDPAVHAQMRDRLMQLAPRVAGRLP